MKIVLQDCVVMAIVVVLAVAMEELMMEKIAITALKMLSAEMEIVVT